MAALVDAIGLASGALGIVSFFQSLVPSDEAMGASIKVKIGNPGADDDPSVGGQIFHAYSWDIHNDYEGQTSGAHPDRGGVADLVVDASSPGQRADYVGLAADDDAICVAWITVAQYDGTYGGAWTGDIGANCGQAWYHNDDTAGYFKDTMDDYYPACTWLDADHTGTTESASMKFKIASYGEGVTDTVNNADQCDATLWGPDKGPISQALPFRRDIKARLPDFRDALVVSAISSHTSDALCNSETSHGPDFVDAHGFFCDMSTKTLMPLCSHEQVDGCVSLDEESKSIMKRFMGFKRAADSVHKSYSSLKVWK